MYSKHKSVFTAHFIQKRFATKSQLVLSSFLLQSSGSSVNTSYSGNNSYSLSTLPTPVARHFTELCVLQTANPFHEYFAMSSSSCDHPATFTAQLAPGNYHAVCSYRLTNGPVAGTFPVDSATPAAFFTACKCSLLFPNMLPGM